MLPASPRRRSGETKVPWDAWVGDYAEIRDAIERTYPETFKDFNKRLFKPGGFARPLPARERKWVTKTRQGELHHAGEAVSRTCRRPTEHDVLHLATLRSNDQFNTTIYGYSDRFRGVKARARIVFMNAEDISSPGLRRW